MLNPLFYLLESEPLKELFLQLLNISISASWLIIAILALRPVMNPSPRWAHVLLWGIVAVRLLCPISIESPLSLIPSTETIPLNIEMAANPAIDSGIGAVNRVINPVIAASFTPNPMTSMNPLQLWIPLGAVVWLLGVVVMAIYTAVSYYKLRRHVAEAVLYRNNIFQSERIDSPFVLGILRPRIYLSFRISEEALPHIIAHEQAHIRRKDHWWKPLGFLLLTLHWFNPLMWAAYILLCRDIELACDEKVIKELDSEHRADYTQTLLNCSIGRKSIAACPLAFGEVGIKQRVKSVMRYQKPALWAIAITVVLCIVVAVCFLTDPKTTKTTFEATLVEIGNQSYLVEPLPNSNELRSADRIRIPAQYLQSDEEPKVGDILSVTYNGEIMESDPAQLGKVYSIRIAEKAESWDTIPMVMVDGVLYLDTGRESTLTGRCGVMDGEITSSVDSGRPTQNDQSNFVTGYGYQFTPTEGVIDILIDDKWWVYATEEARQRLQFPTDGSDLIEIFRSSLDSGDTVIVTDYVYAEDGAYGLKGVVQYADETGAPWKLAFILENFAYPVAQDWGAEYAIAGSLSYVGNGKVKVYVQNTKDGTFYECSMTYAYNEAAKQTDFTSESHEVVPMDTQGDEVFLRMGLNAEIIDIDEESQILYVKDIDPSAEIFGARCGLVCTNAAARDSLIYVNYGNAGDVRTIDFSDFMVGDQIIVTLAGPDTESAMNGMVFPYQVQLGTQRIR